VTTRHRVPVEGGESVVAVHHSAPSDRWLVCCHGFLSDKSGSYERRCRRAAREGYNAVRFDFRGCGESDGAFRDQTLGDKLADLAAVLAHFEAAPAALFGSSFGGKVALHAATGDDRVVAVATRAPVTYNRALDRYRRVVAADGVCRFDDGRAVDDRFFTALESYPFQRVTDTVDVPVAIFHGTGDDSVAVGDSFDAARALPVDVLLETFAGEGHRFSDRAEAELLSRLFDWLSTKCGSAQSPG
jgi:pimeloyl-ACP methyl ester carboxylesterase